MSCRGLEKLKLADCAAGEECLKALRSLSALQSLCLDGSSLESPREQQVLVSALLKMTSLQVRALAELSIVQCLSTSWGLSSLRAGDIGTSSHASGSVCLCEPSLLLHSTALKSAGAAITHVVWCSNLSLGKCVYTERARHALRSVPEAEAPSYNSYYKQRGLLDAQGFLTQACAPAVDTHARTAAQPRRRRDTPRMQYLSVARCGIGSNSGEAQALGVPLGKQYPLLVALQHARALRGLDLNGNKLSGDALDVLRASLLRMPALEVRRTVIQCPSDHAPVCHLVGVVAEARRGGSAVFFMPGACTCACSTAVVADTLHLSNCIHALACGSPSACTSQRRWQIQSPFTMRFTFPRCLVTLLRPWCLRVTYTAQHGLAVRDTEVRA